MYPTLFTIGSFRIDTYSVVWFIALSLAILWSIKRLELYGLDEDESRRIMAVSFMFMLLGARSPEYFANWRIYLDSPKLLLDLNRGGLHESGAVAGAFLTAFVMCMFSKKISFLKLCDTAVIPAFLAIAVGRWGCFLNGCCSGLRSGAFCAVHFPQDRAGIFRHPVQIYYSLTAAVIVLILLWAERRIIPLQKKTQRYYSVIAPFGLVLYILMRYAMTYYRDPQPLSWLISHTWTYKYLTIALPFICLWLAYSLLRLKAEASHR
ncbi:MAG: prolipoprotein diacylglyceryl transferase [Synergistaceae bacterium]|nr:prolipoprotein diacylglyceryl transferase [Synergistaceae bacterium]MBR0034251.1 prolipoprotein diacylglyceryl transferase [Synergistaceae bacterium]